MILGNLCETSVKFARPKGKIYHWFTDIDARLRPHLLNIDSAEISAGIALIFGAIDRLSTFDKFGAIDRKFPVCFSDNAV